MEGYLDQSQELIKQNKFSLEERSIQGCDGET
jgi:hypothetical protein